MTTYTTDRTELALHGLRPADEAERGWFVKMNDGRGIWATEGAEAEYAEWADARRVARRHCCFVEGCEREPMHLRGDNPLCCVHFGSCDCSEEDEREALAGQPSLYAAIVADLDTALQQPLAELEAVKAENAQLRAALDQSVAAMEEISRVHMSDENDESTWATAGDVDAAWLALSAAIVAAKAVRS